MPFLKWREYKIKSFYNPASNCQIFWIFTFNYVFDGDKSYQINDKQLSIQQGLQNPQIHHVQWSGHKNSCGVIINFVLGNQYCRYHVKANRF